MAEVLVLDDDPDRHREFDRMFPRGTHVDHAWTAPQAIRLLQGSSPYDLACLDYDLDKSKLLIGVGNPGNGADVARFIAAMRTRSRPREIIIHSRNPYGRWKMNKILRSAGLSVTVKPFYL